MKAGILKNEGPDSHIKWVVACEKLRINYSVIDLTKADWLDQIEDNSISFFLLRPPGEIQRYKDLYNERVYIISEILKRPVYPSYKELILHENKKFLAYFLDATKTPSPKTHIFHTRTEALTFTQNCSYPIVAKTSLGASGSGVKIVKDSKELKKYIKLAFNKGIKRQFGPNRKTGNVRKWTKKAFSDFKKAYESLRNISFYIPTCKEDLFYCRIISLMILNGGLLKSVIHTLPIKK